MQQIPEANSIDQQILDSQESSSSDSYRNIVKGTTQATRTKMTM